MGLPIAACSADLPSADVADASAPASAGTRIAYLAKGESEGDQIFVRWIDAQGASSQVTRVDQAPSHIRWSPDGTSIAFMMLVRAEEKEEWTIELPKAPSHAEWTEKPRIVERMHYKRDFVGFLADGYTHLFVVSADGGTPRQLTDGEWNVGNRTYGIPFGGGFDWMPDGRTIVFEGQMAEDWDLRYRDANIYAVDVSSRETRQLTAIKGPWTNPVASPDGRYIAFTGYEWTQQSYKASELYIIRPDGSGIEKISGDLERDPEDLNWAPNSSGVYFTSDDQGTQNVHFASLDGEVRQVTEGVHMLSLSSVAANNSAVGVRTSYYQPTDVVSIDLRRPQRITQLTAVNIDLLADKRLGDVEEIWYNSADGTRVQGWIVKPPSFDPSHQSERWYKIRLRVTPTNISAWIDKKQVVDQSIVGHKVSTRNEVDLSMPLGIAAWETQSALRNIRIRKLSKDEVKP